MTTPPRDELQIDVGALLAVGKLDRRAGAQRAPLAECAVHEACLRRGDAVGAGGKRGDPEASLLVGRRGAGPSAARHDDARPLDGAAGVGGHDSARDDRGPRRHRDVALRPLQAAATPSATGWLPLSSGPLSCGWAGGGACAATAIAARERERDDREWNGCEVTMFDLDCSTDGKISRMVESSIERQRAERPRTDLARSKCRSRPDGRLRHVQPIGHAASELSLTTRLCSRRRSSARWSPRARPGRSPASARASARRCC